MTGAERAKLSRIRAKAAAGKTLTNDDRSFMAAHPVPLTLAPAAPPRAPEPMPAVVFDGGNPSIVPNASTGAARGNDGAVAHDEVFDRIIDATGNDDDGHDDDDSMEVGEHAENVQSAAPGAGGAGATGAAQPAPMSYEVSRGTAASAFLLMQSGWTIFGDRDPKHCEPTDEEMRLMARVFSGYAERWGWTHEIDDMILLATVVLVYNARASRAPRKTPKLPKVPNAAPPR